MKIRSVTQYSDWEIGVGIFGREQYVNNNIEDTVMYFHVIPELSLWDQVPRIKDWYDPEEAAGDDTLVTTDYFDEAGNWLAKDIAWASEIKGKENWKNYRISYRNCEDPDTELFATVIKAPRSEYALETFYGMLCLRDDFERFDDFDWFISCYDGSRAPVDFRLGKDQFTVSVEKMNSCENYERV